MSEATITAAAPTKLKGKVSGVKNFTSLEDLNITKAYRQVTCDASVGTDQDAESYYQKIVEKFNQFMGEKKIQDRLATAIRNRWINTIQRALLKFSACMNKAITEFHSGWSLEDYISLAEKYYLAETGKQFAHQMCFQEVKRMPKFCINAEGMSSQMKQALELDEEDIAIDCDDEQAAQEAPATGSASSSRTLRMAPRPKYGKKAAKKLKFTEASESKTDSSSSRQLLYRQIAENGQAKAAAQRDKLSFSLFKLHPDTDEAKEFFTLKKEEALLDAKIRIAEKKRQLHMIMEQGEEISERLTGDQH